MNDISFGTYNNDNDDDEDGDDVNDNIDEDRVTSKEYDEFDKYFNLSVNSDFDSICVSLAGRVLRF